MLLRHLPIARGAVSVSVKTFVRVLCGPCKRCIRPVVLRVDHQRRFRAQRRRILDAKSLLGEDMRPRTCEPRLRSVGIAHELDVMKAIVVRERYDTYFYHHLNLINILILLSESSRISQWQFILEGFQS